MHCSAHLSFCREVSEDVVKAKEAVEAPRTGKVYGPDDGGSTWGVTACTCVASEGLVQDSVSKYL